MEHERRVLNGAPRLTAIVAAIDDYPTVAEALACLEAQTIREAIEVVMVCRSEAALELPEGFRAAHPDYVLVEAGEDVLLHDARALAVRRASAPFVVILEDHALPHDDCLERLVARLEEGTWSVVGPSFVSGNTVSPIARAANLLTYGEWMGYAKGGERRYVAGYSSAWSRERLLSCGAQLGQELAIPSALQERFRAEGDRLYFEAAAVMVHWEGSSLAAVQRILRGQGRAMGAIRARGWSWLRRCLASALAPVRAAYRVWRGARAGARSGHRSPRVLLGLLPLSLTWTLAELAGYWHRDPTVVLAAVSDVEHHRQPLVDPDHEPIRRTW